MRYFYILIFLSNAVFVLGQTDTNSTTSISGHIYDQISKKELENATIELLNFIPRKISQTNSQGEFEIKQIPFGRHKLLISKMGYENKVISDIIIGAGNAFHLEVELEQAKTNGQATSSSSNEDPQANYFKNDKDQPNNSLSSINAEPFTLEEVVRYAGARMDLGRLTNNLAGVTNNYDARNDIVVRGISPAFTAWQLEELPIDNPNHFGFMGSSGGTNSIINIFALGKADFNKSSSNSQFGNSISGIFDLSLRKGNSKTLQFMGVVGTQRAEFLIESPFSKKLRHSSILLSVRHSTGNYLFGQIAKLINNNPERALTIRDWADPRHTDFNLKIDLGKMGKNNVEIFGIGSYMKLFLPYNNRSLRDEIRYIIFENEEFTAKFSSGLLGIKHSYRPNANLLFRNIIGANYQYQQVNYIFNLINSIDETEDLFTSYIQNAYKINYTWHSYLQNKSKKTLSRVGFIANVYDINARGNYILFNYLDVLFDNVFTHSQFYAQTRWDINHKFSLFAGVNVMYSSLANQIAPSPQLNLQYQINNQHNLSLSAGLYHQTQHLQSLIAIPYLGFDSLENNIYDFGERKGKMLSSRQLNFEYNWLISKNWRLKLQAYYYLINNVRINGDSTYYSGLNTNYSFFDTNYDPTTTTGKGKNKGIELSVEKFFHQGWYLLANGTLYDAKVLSSDGIWRNSIFNNRFIANLLIGREFQFGYARQHVFFADLRFSTHGGRPYTPIDEEATFQNGLQNLGTEGVLIDSLYNTPFTPNFYQIDIKLGARFNSLKTKTTHTIRLDLFNAFNFKNIYDYRYSNNFDPFGNPVRGEVIPVYQRGFIPDLTYMIQF